MTQTFVDMDEFSLGTGVPTGMTSLFGTTGVWSVITRNSRNALEWDRDGSSATEHRALSVDSIGVVDETGVIQVAMLVEMPSDFDAHTAGVGIALSGSGSSIAGMSLVRRASNSRRGELLGTGMGTTATVAAWPAGTLIWLRIEKDGTNYSGKAWEDGTTEPASWDATWTGPSIAEGHAGFYVRSPWGTDSGGYFWYAIGVGTDGDEAPLEGATAPDTPTGLTAEATGYQTVEVDDYTVADATSYDGRYTVESAASWTEEIGIGTGPWAVSGLDWNTSYEFQVRALNADGTSAWSASVVEATPNPPYLTKVGASFVPREQTLVGGAWVDS